MNKTPITVRIGDKVTYAIRLFNEGNIEGTAAKITDHLPNYLNFNRAYYMNGATQVDLVTSQTGQDITINNPQGRLAAYATSMTEQQFKDNSQIIYVECTVGIPKNQEIYTNIAEISQYNLATGNDMDSQPSNWPAPSANRGDNAWIHYSNNQDEKLDGDLHPFVGVEDDDDFEKIKIEYMDVALTKRIAGYIDSNDQMQPLVPENSTLSSKDVVNISGYSDVHGGTEGTLKYEMNKKVAQVTRGTKLVTVITVYNEGPIDAVIKEVTDYVPGGLVFNQADTEALNDGKVAFTYDSYYHRLIMKLKEDSSTEGITLNNFENYTNDCDKYEIKIVFDVDRTASGRMYNSAAITNYGYIGADGVYYSAQESGVDRDSSFKNSARAESDGTSLSLAKYHQNNHEASEIAHFDLSKFEKNNLQYEDDDDVDVVEVKEPYHGFDLALRKYIYKVDKGYDDDDGNPVILTQDDRVPVIDEESEDVWSAKNIEDDIRVPYKHMKIKVGVEKGDLITYRIRVYNEGYEDDYRGRATQITDYLPEGLEFKYIESGYTNEWEVDQTNTNSSKVVFNYKGNKILPVNSISALADPDVENPEQYYQEIGIVCEVTADVVNDSSLIRKPLTNRAAITGDKAFDYDGGDVADPDFDGDRDSNPDQLTNLRLDTWYTGDDPRRPKVDEANTQGYFIPGEEDDDDFDTIYVYGYSVKFSKTDGENNLTGVDAKILKYRAISSLTPDIQYNIENWFNPNPLVEISSSEKVELSDEEDELSATGEASYYTSAPTTRRECDVYIIKEITSPDGYYNPFEGKYIKFSIKGDQNEPKLNFRYLLGNLYAEIYEDNGDDDYTNDQLIAYNPRETNNIYSYVRIAKTSGSNEFTVKIVNRIQEKYGKYTVNLYKYGLNKDGTSVQIGGVEFDATGKFDGATPVAIPSQGNKLVTSATNSVKVIPDSIPDGYIDMTNAMNVGTPDEITLTETGIASNAEDAQGNLIADKYYPGLLGHDLKVIINKTSITDQYIKLNTVDTIKLELDGVEIPDGYVLENGTKISVSARPGSPIMDHTGRFIGYEDYTISVFIYNPEIIPSGSYSISLSKTGEDDPYTEVAGIKFNVSGEFSGAGYNSTLGNDYEVITLFDRPVSLVPHDMTDGIIEIDPSIALTTPDYIIIKEKDFDTSSDGDEAKGIYQLALKDAEIKLTINKDVDNTDPLNPVYFVSSIGLEVDGVQATGSDYIKTYTDQTTGAIVKITYDKKTNNINIRVVNPLRIPEGSYSVYLTKTGTNGKQLGGVEFDAVGYFNKEYIDIPDENTKLVTDATNPVAVMPAGETSIVIDPDRYKTNDRITLTETGLEFGATDEDGDSVDAKYYLGFKDKPIAINIKKTVDKTDPVKDVYSIEEISVTLDGNAVPAKSGVANTYEYVNETNGAKLTVSLNTQTNRIDIVVSNPTKTHEGDYSINIKKMATNGRQLGGVEFDTTGHFNGTTGSEYTVTTLPNATVDMLPSSFNGIVEIDENHYSDADVITFEESGYANGAVDDQGTAVDGNYYLALDGKEFELTINKDVNHLETKDVYYVSSLGLKVNGSTNNVTGSGFSYTYDDPDSDATVTVSYSESTKSISIVATNVLVEREGTYHVKLIKYKQGTNTPVAGVKFTASAHVDGLTEIIATTTNPIVTDTTAVSVKDNVPMSEENINDNDTFTLKEVDVGSSNSDIFIGYTGDIGVRVKKKMDTSNPAKKVFLVDTVTLVVNGQDVPNNSITLENGTKIEVSYNSNTKTIEVKVTDPIKEGSFKINLVKYKTVDEDDDGNYDPLQGATFDIVVNDGTSNIKTVTNQVTNANGEIPEISGINITAENLTYTITVTEVSAPTGYIGIGAPVTFTAKSKFNGSKYVLDTSVQPTITNNYIQAEVSDDEILIEAENRVEPIIHKGVKTVENQDSGYDKNEIQTWVINTSVPTGIADYTKYVVTDTIDPEKTTVSEKRIAFLNESNPASNVVVKYKGTDTTLTEGTDYKVAFNTLTKQLTITFINATNGADSFVGGRSLTEESVLEIKYNTQFTLDDNGDPIGLNQSIPNKATLTYNGNGNEEKTKDSEEPEVHTGGLGVYKYDKETNEALEGAKFRLVRTRSEAEAAVAALWAEDQAAINNIEWVTKYNEDGSQGPVWEVTTDSNGYAYFAGLEFGKDASDSESNRTNNGKGGSTVYEYDWENASTTYYLVETYVPEDYVLLEEVAAECIVKKDSFVKTDLTTYHKVGNEVVVEEGEYAVEIAKYGKYEDEEPHPLAGVIFSAKRTVNGQAEENLGNLDETDSTGRTLVGDTVTIERDYVSTDDVYTIREVSVPEDSEYYVGLNKDIVLTVSKQSVKSADKKTWLNSVTGINMSIEGETVTEEVAGQKYTATVVKDGQSLVITAELLEDDNGGQYIKLSVENPHKVGKFPLHIVKTIKGTNPATPLPNAGFKVSIKLNGEYVTDGNGNAINGTHEYFTDDQGNILIENIDIRRPGLTYTVEVEETTVPAGYIGLGDKFTYTVTSAVDGEKLSLVDEDGIVVTNDVEVNVEDGEIWNYVEDKPEPVIHKGVRTVRNQDAGYDGDEIQTWVINSTVPAGIGDYTQYIITDTIDPDKTNNDEKRIEFLGLNTIHVFIIGMPNELVQGVDYLASFDDSTKTIKITLIEGEFKKGQELPEDTTLEVKYNTKFRLDENGLIIGLNQSIPNQAHLTFNGNGKDQKTKHSETPEVHTGAVGVVKYEDINKNGEFDDEDKVLEGAHFKIVRTKDEADRALAAVLAGDTETLNTINFVKVRDDDGNLTNTDVELVTGEDGTAIYEGLEFGENASDKESNKGPNGVGGFETYNYNWETASTTYYLVETEAPYDYYLLDRYETFVVSKDSYVRFDLSTYYKEADKPKIYDLSLRKFITHVNGTDVEGNAIDRNITDRIPQVTLTDEFKDKENEDVTTAVYEHTKEPVIVQQGNTVTYTIRIYNEGPEDAYAAVVKDDIPDGVIFVPYTEGDGSVNDEYRWKLVDENDNPVDDASKAKYIVTDYLSMEQGEVKDGVNVNLLRGYDSDVDEELDYRDVKVQFYVTEPNTSERIITNYAQIAKMTNSDNVVEKDRDSTPNEWIEGEDDQDVEHIKLLYFDLALRKWVTKAIVISDGEEKVYETGHKAEDDPEDVVKVDLKKSKIDKVIVKFEYQIRITNEGRIGGWCDEITDHIPDGLTFDQADNPTWAVVDSKTVTTDALKTTYLEPGESAEVTIVLRWENSGDNLGIKVNVAEISKDRNEYGVHDIDSTPGNYKWGEDDIDDAPVMLAITTGNRAIGYTILGLVVVSIVAVGAKAIKKVREE